MKINFKKIEFLLTTVLILITGLFSMLFLGFGIIFLRIDLDVANKIAPFLLLSSIVLLFIFIFACYKRKKIKKYNLKFIFFSAVGILVVSWLFFFSAVFLFQGTLIYQRQGINNERLEWIRAHCDNVSEISIPSGDIQLYGWYVRNSKEKESPLIIYFGGGAEEISKRISDFSKIEGWSTVLINYRGYGLSEGSPCEEDIFKDTLNIYDYFHTAKDIDKDKIVVLGRSLGTGPAVYLAAKRKLYKTILISPYDSQTNWLQYNIPFIPASLVMKSPFDSISRAPSINTEVLCLVGEKDRSVFPSQSEKLVSKWGGKHSSYTIKGATHNTILYTKECWEKVKQFLYNFSG